MTIVVLRSTNWGFVGRTSIGHLPLAKTGLVLFGEDRDGEGYLFLE